MSYLYPHEYTPTFRAAETVAEAVSASHDLRLPAEHMPLDAEIGSSKRKKKSLGWERSGGFLVGIIPRNDVESWLINI